VKPLMLGLDASCIADWSVGVVKGGKKKEGCGGGSDEHPGGRA